MDTRCRVCIEKGGEWTLLNTKIQNSSNQTFFDFLNKCTSLNACENDNLPQSLCSVCTRIIRTFYTFVKLAEKSDTILREALKKTIATERCNDNREFSWEQITIRNEMVEEEAEDFNEEDSFFCQRSTSTTGSSLYIVEEERISERPPSVARISEIDEFYSNLDHPELYMEEPVDVLSSSCDGHLEGIDIEYRDSEDDGPISLLGKRLGTNKDETDSQSTKNEYQNLIKIGDECRNQVSTEAAADSFTGHTETSYKCKVCDIVFNDKEEFEKHCRDHVYRVTHDEKKKYKCSICGKDFKHASTYMYHIRIHSGERPYECEICSKKFTTKYYLKAHLARHNGVIKKCGLCGKELKNSYTLYQHMQRHTNPKPYKCENCGKLFADKYSCTRHMETCTPVGNSNEESHRKRHTENTCTECDMVFNDKEEFEAHCRNHRCKDKHECNICGKKFARQQYLQNHLVTHDEKKKYKCSICGKDFKHASAHRYHMRIHSDENPLKCKTCGKKFRSKAEHESHLRVHLNISHKCPQCGKIFKMKRNLLSHINKHAEKKLVIEKHECEICSKKFITKYKLKYHMEKHSVITKKTGQCGKELKSRESLRSHVKCHTNSKPFKCESCGKLFASKQNVTRHMQICKPQGTSKEGTVTI